MRNDLNANTLSIEVLKQNLNYDPDTGFLFWKNQRGCKKPGEKAGCLDHEGYIKIRLMGICLIAHRIAWAIHHGSHPEAMLDHVNGIRSDNRISNLRCCDRFQNMRNQKRQSGNTSGFKGVTRLPHGSFQAQIGGTVEKKYIGSFKTAEEAARAYDIAAKRLHGEFANLNFPQLEQQP